MELFEQRTTTNLRRVPIMPGTGSGHGVSIEARYVYLHSDTDESFTELPDNILQLREMMSLSIVVPNLKSLHPLLYTMENLEVIVVTSEGYEHIGRDLWQVTQLKTLDLSETQIQEIPKELPTYLTNLQMLILKFNRELRGIPENIKGLQSLFYFSIIGSSNIQRIPRSIGELRNLETLKLSQCGIQELPVSIGNLENLQTLDVSDNELSAVPYTIWKLTALRELRIAKNKLSVIHPTVSTLHNLRLLALQWNQLEYIPDNLRQLTKLRYLNLSHNPPLESVPSFLLDRPRSQRFDVILLPNPGISRWMQEIQTESVWVRRRQQQSRGVRYESDTPVRQAQRLEKGFISQPTMAQPQSLLDIVTAYVAKRTFSKSVDVEET